MTTKEKFLKKVAEHKVKQKAKAEEIGRIAKLGKEAFKKVTLGISSEESLFILGFVAGYKKKKNENKNI